MAASLARARPAKLEALHLTLTKQLHGPSSERQIHENFSKEQILFSLFAPGD